MTNSKILERITYLYNTKQIAETDVQSYVTKGLITQEEADLHLLKLD